MKHFLDQEKIVTQLDPGHVYDSITQFDAQLNSSWQEVEMQTIKTSPKNIKKICIAGMGGSALAARILKSLTPLICHLPFEIVNNYRLPNWVDKNTLVILSSYSGNTEEIVSSAMDALAKKAHIFTIASGGELSDLAQKNDWDLYTINPQHNPSGQPRLGLGYSLGAHLGYLSRFNLIDTGKIDRENIIQVVVASAKNLKHKVEFKNNPAKMLAEKAKGKAVIIFSANHIAGAAYAGKNHINESAKTFADSFVLPELNHHLLEGLSLPDNFNQNTHFILINSDLYPDKIKKRLQITQEILDKQKYPLTVIKPDSDTMMGQALEVLIFFEYFSFYLATINHVDPSPIPWVDYFKKRLKE